MTLDIKDVARIAHLARLKVPEEEQAALVGQLNGILHFIAQLNEVDVTGIEPMTGCHDMPLRWRADEVHDGGRAEDVLANAPQRAADFFAVPKVVE
ncbi:MAG: Asp-tRNA(Asn)/Glu-tRNA(Gln) amidotransferase subunit GatC [Alphaproteobacteria bacterium]